MDNWLKALVACACVVVISGGGYYALGEYSAHQRENERRDRANREASVKNQEAVLKSKFSTAECIRMAKETLPDKKGWPIETTKYNNDLSICDDLQMFDPTWRQVLDMAGVF